MAWDQSGSWDLSQTPVLLAGADGHIHETRPTTTLARDLAEAQAYGYDDTSNDACSRPRRLSDPDERPIRPAGQRSPDNRSARASRSAADRPLGGFGSCGSASASSPAAAGRRMSTGSFSGNDSRRGSASAPLAGYTGAASSNSPSSGSGYSGAAPRRRTSTGSMPLSGTYSQNLDCNNGGSNVPRRSSSSYSPVDTLVNMGFDKDLARVAISAAGGDIDRAVRIMLEDAQAHDARRDGEWEFEGDKGWVPFDCETDAILSQAFGRGDSACEIRAGGNRYLVDFDSSTQLNLASKKTRSIRRRGVGASSSSSAPAPSRG